MLNRRVRNEKGFTLIEIIAVLIILGILAAVAVPKFLDLTEQAEERALEGGLAAGMSALSLEFARYTLANEQEPTSAELASNVTDPASEEFEYTFTSTGTDTVEVTVTNQNGKSTSGEFEMP